MSDYQKSRETVKREPLPIALFAFIVRLIVLTIALGLGIVWSLLVVLGSLPLMLTERKSRRGL